MLNNASSMIPAQSSPVYSFHFIELNISYTYFFLPSIFDPFPIEAAAEVVHRNVSHLYEGMFGFKN